MLARFSRCIAGCRFGSVELALALSWLRDRLLAFWVGRQPANERMVQAIERVSQGSHSSLCHSPDQHDSVDIKLEAARVPILKATFLEAKLPLDAGYTATRNAHPFANTSS